MLITTKWIQIQILIWYPTFSIKFIFDFQTKVQEYLPKSSWCATCVRWRRIKNNNEIISGLIFFEQRNFDAYDTQAQKYLFLIITARCPLQTNAPFLCILMLHWFSSRKVLDIFCLLYLRTTILYINCRRDYSLIVAKSQGHLYRFHENFLLLL